MTRGAGRYNFALGAVTTAQGIGASLSGLVAGVIVDRLGYSAAFVGCGVAATAALAVLLAFVPESRGPAATANSLTPGCQGTCAVRQQAQGTRLGGLLPFEQNLGSQQFTKILASYSRE